MISLQSKQIEHRNEKNNNDCFALLPWNIIWWDEDIETVHYLIARKQSVTNNTIHIMGHYSLKYTHYFSSHFIPFSSLIVHKQMFYLMVNCDGYIEGMMEQLIILKHIIILILYSVMNWTKQCSFLIPVGLCPHP